MQYYFPGLSLLVSFKKILNVDVNVHDLTCKDSGKSQKKRNGSISWCYFMGLSLELGAREDCQLE